MKLSTWLFWFGLGGGLFATYALGRSTTQILQSWIVITFFGLLCAAWLIERLEARVEKVEKELQAADESLQRQIDRIVAG